MATQSEEIKSIEITVRFGDAPEFRIAASKKKTALPAEMTYVTRGYDDLRLEVLVQILNKLIASYPDSDFIKLCIENGQTIVSSAKC